MVGQEELLINLNKTFHQLLMEQRETNRLLRGKLEEATKPYLDHEDMRVLFGWPATASNSHKKRLAWLRRQGFLSKFGNCRPYLYERSEAEAVAQRVQVGLIHVPATF